MNSRQRIDLLSVHFEAPYCMIRAPSRKSLQRASTSGWSYQRIYLIICEYGLYVILEFWYGSYDFGSLEIIGYVWLVHSDATLSLCSRKPNLGWLLTVEVFITLLAGVISSKGDVPISAPKLDASSMEFIKSIQLSEQLDRKKYSYNIPSRSIR